MFWSIPLSVFSMYVGNNWLGVSYSPSTAWVSHLGCSIRDSLGSSTFVRVGSGRFIDECFSGCIRQCKRIYCGSPVFNVVEYRACGSSFRVKLTLIPSFRRKRDEVFNFCNFHTMNVYKN